MLVYIFWCRVYVNFVFVVVNWIGRNIIGGMAYIALYFNRWTNRNNGNSKLDLWRRNFNVFIFCFFLDLHFICFYSKWRSCKHCRYLLERRTILRGQAVLASLHMPILPVICLHLGSLGSQSLPVLPVSHYLPVLPVILSVTICQFFLSLFMQLFHCRQYINFSLLTLDQIFYPIAFPVM